MTIQDLEKLRDGILHTATVCADIGDTISANAYQDCASRVSRLIPAQPEPAPPTPILASPTEDKKHKLPFGIFG
jgi:hypothetical protein